MDGVLVMAHQMQVQICVSCGKTLDAATLPEGEDAPSPGDISLCLYCGHLMAYADDLELRNLTDEEMHEVAGDPHILRMQRARGRIDG
jgi:hypothetical protein